LWLHSLKVAQLLRSAACLHTNQSRSYLNHLVHYGCWRALRNQIFSEYVWNNTKSSLKIISYKKRRHTFLLFDLHNRPRDNFYRKRLRRQCRPMLGYRQLHKNRLFSVVIVMYFTYESLKEWVTWGQNNDIIWENSL